MLRIGVSGAGLGQFPAMTVVSPSPGQSRVGRKEGVAGRRIFSQAGGAAEGPFSPSPALVQGSLVQITAFGSPGASRTDGGVGGGGRRRFGPRSR